MLLEALYGPERSDSFLRPSPLGACWRRQGANDMGVVRHSLIDGGDRPGFTETWSGHLAAVAVHAAMELGVEGAGPGALWGAGDAEADAEDQEQVAGGWGLGGFRPAQGGDAW
ncbi:MAG: hypothetical protein WBM08_09160 [Prochlorococcaceae cyanobacterium]